MKIYQLNVDKKFQIRQKAHNYPPHSAYCGVEIEFYDWLQRHPDLLTDDPRQADRHYLPVFWTNWHIAHQYGKEGREELAAELKRVMIDPAKTFTLCQYADGPLVATGAIEVYLSSRGGEQGRDMPLLCAPHLFEKKKRVRRFLAGFVGRMDTHPLRAELSRLTAEDGDFRFTDGYVSERFFIEDCLQSYAALCPRGFGGGSYRFFEAMQLGVVPVHIGNTDIRPFKELVPWEEMSFYFATPAEAVAVLKNTPKDLLAAMGQKARNFWYGYFYDGRWCGLLVKEQAQAVGKDYEPEAPGVYDLSKIDNPPFWRTEKGRLLLKGLNKIMFVKKYRKKIKQFLAEK